MRDYLDFEKPIRELEEKSRSWFPPSPQVRHAGRNPEASDQTRAGRAPTLYQSDAWQRTQLARHPQRPTTLDYISELSREFSNSMVIAASATIARLSADSPASMIARS